MSILEWAQLILVILACIGIVIVIGGAILQILRTFREADDVSELLCIVNGYDKRIEELEARLNEMEDTDHA